MTEILSSKIDIDVRKRIGNFELDVQFSSEHGITAFFGRSGSGKTSLVNLLAGLSTPDQGRISVAGRELFNSTNGVNLTPQKRRLGYVFQEGRLFPHMTVRQNLRYGLRFVPNAERRQDFNHVVDLLALDRFLDRQPRSLSGGEKQRVAIGRALLTDPRILLMDEPLASLDAGHKGEILPYIEGLRDEFQIPIVYVSHSLDEVIRLADTMVLLDQGNSRASGTVEDIMSRLDLRPLTGRYEAGAVLPVTVVGGEPEFGLTVLSCPAGTLIVPGLDAPVGSSFRLRVRARDVSLSLDRPENTSVLNVFEGTVSEILGEEGPQTEVLVDVGVPLIARVTRKSVATLELAPGKRIFAMVKAAAIDRHSMGMVGTRPRKN